MSPLAVIALAAAALSLIGLWLGLYADTWNARYWGAFWNVFGGIVLAICGLVWIWP